MGIDPNRKTGGDYGTEAIHGGVSAISCADPAVPMRSWWKACALASLLLTLAAGPGNAQGPPALEPEEVVNPWTFTGNENSFSNNEAGGQKTRVLSITPSIWLRRLTEGRTLGLRLRLTGIIAFTDFASLEEFDVNSVRIGGVIPGIEVLIPLGSRSMLRPYLDLGIGLTNSAIERLSVADIGIRTEFVFPWRRWELGLEPRAQVGWADASRDLVDASYAVIGIKADARYPLGFSIGGQVPDIGAYVESGWFPNGIQFETTEGTRSTVNDSYEVGVTLGFRLLAPKIWFIRVPRLGVGYRFGDGLTGLRIRIGGDRVTRLPLP